jgi:hypothetical protein
MECRLTCGVGTSWRRHSMAVAWTLAPGSSSPAEEMDRIVPYVSRISDTNRTSHEKRDIEGMLRSRICMMR